MKPWYRNSTLQMDDPEMEWLQGKDPATCAVWEWLKGDCQKRGTNKVRTLSDQETETISRRLGIDSPRFSQISKSLQDVGWVSQGSLKGWEKWQSDGRSHSEDALRKQVEYWKKKAGLHGVTDSKQINLPESPKTSPLEERRGEDLKVHIPEKTGGVVKKKTEPDPRLKELNDAYCRITGRNSNLEHAGKYWVKFLKGGYSIDKLEVVLRWIIHKNSTQTFKTDLAVHSLTADLGKFDGLLGGALAWDRNRPKPRTARETVLAQARPTAGEGFDPRMTSQQAGTILAQIMPNDALCRPAGSEAGSQGKESNEN